MNEEILTMLERIRHRLNSAIIVHRIFVWIAPAVGVAASGAALLKIAGHEGYAVLAFILLLVFGALIGGVKGFRSRMGTTDTARWLDEKLGDDELFCAALVCIERGRTGRFDEAVLQEAFSLAPKAAKVRIPILPIVKKTSIAFAVSIAGVLALMLIRPFETSYTNTRKAERSTAETSQNRNPAELSENEIAASASALASSIFPDDKRMATLAERALREGRMEDFRSILKGADIESTPQIERKISELEKRKLTRDTQQMNQELLSQFASTQSGRSSDEGGTEGQSEGERSPQISDGTEEESPFGGRQDGEDNGVGGEAFIDKRQGRSTVQGGTQEDSSRNPGYGEALSMSGKGWGVGTSNEQQPWSSIEPSKSEKKETLELKDDSSFFELVLPGENASVPLSSLLPSSKRAAESAMSRKDIPYEYLDFVRSYFMALTKGASE